MDAVSVLSPDAGPVETRPPEDDIEGDDDDDVTCSVDIKSININSNKVQSTTIIFEIPSFFQFNKLMVAVPINHNFVTYQPLQKLRAGYAVLITASSVLLDETMVERLWGLTEMFPDTLRSAAEVSAQCSLSLAKKVYSFSRTALWIGTTSFMILVLPVVFETERLQLEQQQLQQQRQILLGPNAGISGVIPGMAPVAPGKV